MSTAVMKKSIAKTPAEIAIAEEFDRIGGKLPGGRAVSAARRAAMATFRDRGLPHRRIEEWKYTDLRNVLKESLPLAIADRAAVSADDLRQAMGPLAAIDAHRFVLVNGQHRPELSDIGKTEGIDMRPLGATLKTMEEDAAVRILKSPAPADETVGSLNAALATDGVIISAASGAKADKPIFIVHVTAGREPRHAALRHTIGALDDADLTVVELYVSVPGAIAGHINTAAEIGLGRGATVRHTVVTLGGNVHVSSAAPTLGAEARYAAFHFTADSQIVRNQSFPTFSGEGGKLDFSGVMLGRGTSHCDTTLVIDHAVPGCESRELFKAVLDNRARAVFQGKVIVRPDAQKTDGKQMAQALMLSEDAEFDSKPELEIYADDVVCGHGATCAEIDPGMMFYLRARGIPKAEARALLIESFIVEAVEKIEDEAVREALATAARDWLHKLA